MPKKTKPNNHTNTDIFQLLTETSEKEKKKRRQELLAPLNLTEYFTNGNITINNKTCKGIECKLCIKACPTNALYWSNAKVKITHELCIYCGACVLSCIVDDCIKIERKRQNGTTESFSRPQHFTTLQHKINTKKRFDRIREIQDLLPKPQDYIKRRKRKTDKKQKKLTH